MALSKAEKAAYNDEIKDIKKDVDVIGKAINEVMQKKRKLPNISVYYDIEGATLGMRKIKRYLEMNDLSVEMLGIKNSTFLENARKEFYKVLQYMEQIVGSDIDRSLKENDEYLIKIDRLNPRQILDVMQNINRIFIDLKNKFGQDSKWKWSFVELNARVSVITKNITNFSDIAKLRDPRTEYFYERRDMMDMCKESLTEAAQQYRTKYEVAGKAREDLKKSIEFLSALRKIHVLFGENEEANKLKTTIDATKQALASEDKSKDKEKKNKKKKKK